MRQAERLPGTLDLLILKAISLGPHTDRWNRTVFAMNTALRAQEA